MKWTTGDVAMIIIACVGAVMFYLERAVWDAHGWSRNSLMYPFIVIWGAVYLGWRLWKWWRGRNSN